MINREKFNDRRRSAPSTEIDQIDLVNRHKLISIAAYLKAEKRGFSPNKEVDDWLEAEREIKIHLETFSS